MFRQYHYLSVNLGAGVRCYCAVYQNKPIAFVAVAAVRMRAKYYRVSRLVVLPDYQGIGVGKRLLNFIAELYISQTKLPFYLVTSNPQLIRGNLNHWIIRRVGHGSHGKEDTRINRELVNSNSRRRLSVSMVYDPRKKSIDVNLLC
jgi:GNAT superfamily N-acetyltransferase